MSVLDHFTDDQLLEELVRRRNNAKPRQPARWCEECLHYRHWASPSDMPADYNPCQKRHRMEFHTPTKWQDADCFGHYRIICTDRQECPA